MIRQSVLDPAAAEAVRIGALWWGFLALTAAVFALMVIALVVALFRRRDPVEAPDGRPLVDRPPAEERSARRWMTGALAVSTAILVALIGWSTATGHAVAALPSNDPLFIEVTGHQWWWEIRYPDKPDQIVTTANEIHVPIGRTVIFELASHDVVHSLWLPSLNGKRDLIPGHKTTLTMHVDQPGVYRGQCAEFCGYQHAKMGLLLVAEAAADFEAWRAHQLAPAAAPATASARHGRDVFMSGPCVMCHRVSGTFSLATLGPDLSHLATRRTLAAGALPFDREALAAWIRDPQRTKPGCNMPALALDDASFDALLDYLEGLR